MRVMEDTVHKVRVTKRWRSSCRHGGHLDDVSKLP